MKTQRDYSKLHIDAALYLVRVAVGNWDGSFWKPLCQFSLADWQQAKRFASDQHVPAIALDGVHVLLSRFSDIHPQVSQDDWDLFYMQWVGQQMMMDQQYERYVASLGRLAAFYQQHGIRMMVLKGYGLSLNYPVPSHRPVGDLDIYLFGKQVEADSLIAESGIKVDKSHHHHTTFTFENLFVENHYDFLNIYSHQQNRQIEEKLKWLSFSCKHDDVIPNVFFPTDEFNTIFLLRHMGGHFAAEKMTLRQLLDWALSPQVELKEEYKMHDYRQIVNAICNEYLGFNLPVDRVDRAMMQRVFDDMVSPYPHDRLTPWVRLRRWLANRWKNQLFYQENLLATFFIQLWSHLVRPKGHA